MLNNIHDLYDSLDKRRIMLSFKGDLTPDLINALLSILERKLDSQGSDLKARKRVFNMVTECLQNLYHHNLCIGTGKVDTSSPDRAQGVVMIAHDERGYSVLTGNFMAGEEVAELRSHLDRINGCDPVELRELYKRTLNNGRFSRAGGGGSGMIDRARKSGRKLEYGFIPLDGQHAFFSLNVNVTT